MSKANASAKQRRAFGNNPVQSSISPSQSPSQIQTSGTQGLTLQQVISLFDRRIVNLESIVKDMDSNRKVTFEDEIPENNSNSNAIGNLPEIINEFNSRFEMFAQEIGDLKDALLKLQTYTMDVNKILLEERSKTGGDLGKQPETVTAETDEYLVQSTTSNNNKKSRN